MEPNLVILGASTRAAAFSALRANLRPWCIDLFGDMDLRGRCPVQTIAPEDYPGGLVRLRLSDGRVTEETRYVIDPGERVRDVRQGPDGLVYLLIDSSRGRIVRLEPPR